MQKYEIYRAHICAHQKKNIHLQCVNKQIRTWGQHDKFRIKTMKTYDIYFNDANDSNNKGFKLSIEECKSWIDNNRGESYFEDYQGGTVSIVCNETGETVYEENI